jgi:hypothetical protein
MTFWVQIGIILVGCGASLSGNWLMLMWYFHWKKREEQPESLKERVDKLEAAFVSHTGITINGKTYRTEE